MSAAVRGLYLLTLKFKQNTAGACAGKTLIARQIGKMLNGKEPKIVNGPEVLNKYVGASEENVRNLFKVRRLFPAGNCRQGCAAHCMTGQHLMPRDPGIAHSQVCLHQD